MHASPSSHVGRRRRSLHPLLATKSATGELHLQLGVVATYELLLAEHKADVELDRKKVEVAEMHVYVSISASRLTAAASTPPLQGRAERHRPCHAARGSRRWSWISRMLSTGWSGANTF